MKDCMETDVLTIGSGIAGAVCALGLAKAGVNVVMITRTSDPEETNTRYAQGGVVYKGINDNPELLSQDIGKAGAYLANPSAVKIISEEGPKLVEKILMREAGVAFDTEPDKNLSLVREGGHSINRIVHVSDATGKAIEHQLLRVLKTYPNVTIFTKTTAIDLLTPAHHSLNRQHIYEPLSCIGAYVFDQKDSAVNKIIAKYTVLATGGLGQIFLYTTNPEGSRGDGIALANRAGARTINLEFIQFHPTAFVHRDAPRFLISEAVRGEGARLVNKNGVPFMQKYDRRMSDLSTRDIVSRGIYTEMLLTGAANMYLDLRSYISSQNIRKHFPTICDACSVYGIDPTRDLVPVAPAAHYSCGGIWVDDWGRTSIEHLFAVGEAACTGLHGANRLASTSLLEGLTYGYRAAVQIRKNIINTSTPDPQEIPAWNDQGITESDPALIAQDMSTIKNIMWNYVGLVRKEPLLERALHDLANLEEEIKRFYRKANLTDSLMGLRNAVRTANLVAQAAWENKQSAGCHHRE